MTISALVCCTGNPALALTPPYCPDCSIEEHERLNNQYYEMQRIEQRQRMIESQLLELEYNRRYSY